MNKFDKPRANCQAKERDAAWYNGYFQKEILRRQKKELARLQHQEQRDKLSLSQQSQDVLGSQSQELTLYESEMRESMDVARREDPNRNRNTTRDIILKRLIYTAGESKPSHGNSRKKGQKKHVTSWISKYHFHESLLQDDKEEAQNSKDAAAAVAADAAAKAIADATANDAAPSAKPLSSKKKVNSSKMSKEPNEGSTQVGITNSPPPSPETAASSMKKGGESGVAIKSEEGTVSAKKRSNNDTVDEFANDSTTSSSRKKQRPSSSAKKKSGGEVQVVTHHENGHDVLVILDSDDDDEDEDEDEVDEKGVKNGDETTNKYDDDFEDCYDSDDGVDGVLV